MIAIPIVYIMIGLGISFLLNARDDWTAHIALAFASPVFIAGALIIIIGREGSKFWNEAFDYKKKG
ncbi:hypothetical protein AAV35_012780 [Salimicrobium jeotgali]|uniref:Uncharacterized protein n=1 Tax=Salimicrobium jeotgali TaxID=1230341 RepID=K2H3M3_9BACI|nr:hypothetical protein [Salimicrobium jeotgali]AKG05538.1 hypothetical protein AAV35_012780 [Salimicrobium jeotgali]EKE30470.1 hypothetical protein MJ3_13554 [Salimicrobium jeotgali]MBM7696616.1 Ca2+/Na+ antiporter [Salimicrobium jeotgali]